MKIDKFVNKLRNEAKNNPKKAGMLALLLVVAFWFWAPLLAKWFLPSSDPAIAATTATLDTSTAPPAESPAETSTNTSTTNIKAKIMQFPWREISNWIERDPRMSPAAESTTWVRDPFRPAPKPVATTPPKQVVKEIAVVEPTEFKLSSTLVGTRRKTARINGKSYSEGDVLVSESHKDVEFEIKEITSRKVVLERMSHQFELKIHTADLADKGGAASGKDR